jgi:hypothetical protein
MGNSSSQKKFPISFSIYIFDVFIKYEKSRDENGQETESGGSSPPGARAHSRPRRPVVRPPRNSFPSRFPPVTSFRCLIFTYITPPDCPRSVYHVLVVFLFRSILVRRLFSVLEASWLPQATTRRRRLQKMITKTSS